MHRGRMTRGGRRRVGGDDIRGGRDHLQDLASILNKIGAMDGFEGVVGSDLYS